MSDNQASSEVNSSGGISTNTFTPIDYFSAANGAVVDYGQRNGFGFSSNSSIRNYGLQSGLGLGAASIGYGYYLDGADGAGKASAQVVGSAAGAYVVGGGFASLGRAIGGTAGSLFGPFGAGAGALGGGYVGGLAYDGISYLGNNPTAPDSLNFNNDGSISYGWNGAFATTSNANNQAFFSDLYFSDIQAYNSPIAFYYSGLDLTSLDADLTWDNVLFNSNSIADPYSLDSNWTSFTPVITNSDNPWAFDSGWDSLPSSGIDPEFWVGDGGNLGNSLGWGNDQFEVSYGDSFGPIGIDYSVFDSTGGFGFVDNIDYSYDSYDSYDYSYDGGWDMGGFAWPVALDLDGDGVELSWLEGSATYFDQDNDGYLEQTSWVSSDDGLLVIDLASDGSAGADGIIDQTDELQLINWGSDAQTDLEGLRQGFDSNNDSVFDSRDNRFGEFRVWQDLDQDGEADEGELRTLTEAGIASIALLSDGIEETIAGNFLAGHSSYTTTDGTVIENGVGDVAFRYDENGYRISNTDNGFVIEFEQGVDLNYFVAPENSTGETLDLATDSYAGAVGSEGDDVITTSGSIDIFASGGAGDDTLTGGTGNDMLLGGDGADVLAGGEGHDTIFFDANDTTVEGGEGFDTAINTSKDAVTMNLTDHGFEAAYGNEGDDNFSATGKHAITVSAGGGNDILLGAKGDDILSGDNGDDNISGNKGDDILLGGAGTDSLSGGKGKDTLFGGAGDDTLNGGKGNDILIGGDGTDALDGGTGRDRLFGGVGDDTLTGADGKDDLYGGEGDDTLQGGDDNDFLLGNAGEDTLEGGKGKDTLTGGAGNDILNGEAGDDTYIFNRGDGQDELHDYAHSRKAKKKRAWYEIATGEEVTSLSKSVFKNGDGVELARNEVRSGTKLVYRHKNGGKDALQFGNNISVNDLSVTMSGNDLLVGLEDLEGAFNEDYYLQANPDVAAAVEAGDYVSGYHHYLFEGREAGLSGTDPDGFEDQVKIVDWTNKKSRLEWFRFEGGVALDVSEIKHALSGGAGDDTLTTKKSQGAWLSGGAGNDDITGSKHDDVLIGGEGNDHISGGRGSDTYVFGYGDGQDVYSDKSGSDNLLFGEGITLEDLKIEKIGKDLTITLHQDGEDAADSNEIDSVTIKNWKSSSRRIETLQFTDGFDFDLGRFKSFINGGDETETLLRGSKKADWIDGSANDDTIQGRSGNDVLFGRDGADVIDGGSGNDLIIGGAGNDIITDKKGYNYIFAGEGDDTITVTAGSGGVIDAGAGNDTITGDTGDDYIIGGSGDDHFYRSRGDDTYIFSVGDGRDTFSGGGRKHGLHTDIVEFQGGIQSERLWFSQLGDDLVVNIMGFEDQMTFEGWFDVNKRHGPIEAFVAGDQRLKHGNVDQLVSAMASFEPNNGADAYGVTTDRIPESVQLAVNAAWTTS